MRLRRRNGRLGCEIPAGPAVAPPGTALVSVMAIVFARRFRETDAGRPEKVPAGVYARPETEAERKKK